MSVQEGNDDCGLDARKTVPIEQRGLRPVFNSRAVPIAGTTQGCEETSSSVKNVSTAQADKAITGSHLKRNGLNSHSVRSLSGTQIVLYDQPDAKIQIIHSLVPPPSSQNFTNQACKREKCHCDANGGCLGVVSEFFKNL